MERLTWQGLRSSHGSDVMEQAVFEAGRSAPVNLQISAGCWCPNSALRRDPKAPLLKHPQISNPLTLNNHADYFESSMCYTENGEGLSSLLTWLALESTRSSHLGACQWGHLLRGWREERGPILNVGCTISTRWGLGLNEKEKASWASSSISLLSHCRHNITSYGMILLICLSCHDGRDLQSISPNKPFPL